MTVNEEIRPSDIDLISAQGEYFILLGLFHNFLRNAYIVKVRRGRPAGVGYQQSEKTYRVFRNSMFVTVFEISTEKLQIKAKTRRKKTERDVIVCEHDNNNYGTLITMTLQQTES